MILSGVAFASDPNTNLLGDKEIIVANVIRTPTVTANSDIIYSTASNDLRINGTGFMGVKFVDLYFKPNLYKEVGYEIVSPFPLVSDQVILRLRDGYSWREGGAGPLSVMGIDTGGGPVKVNGEEGIRVAVVQADLESTAKHDDPNLIITGAGFNVKGNSSSFSNGIMGKGVKYYPTELIILKYVQTVYDKSPKIRIKGSGFDADPQDILLTLYVTGQPPLKGGSKDFSITKDDDGIILRLTSGRR